MADGQEYVIPHRDGISLSPKGTFGPVYDDDERFYVLPLLTTTGPVSTVAKSHEAGETELPEAGGTPCAAGRRGRVATRR
jgi:hypothetical protein